jgi:site-specific DNA recombinase
MMTAPPWLLYTRVSTEDQAAGGISMDSQLHACRSYAAAKGWTVGEEIADPGESAKNLRRPGMQRVVDMMQRRECSGVISWRLDRLTRSVRDLVSLLDLTNDAVAIVSVTESLDTSSPMGRFFCHMLGAIAQWERETIGARVSASRQHAKRQGFWTGGAIPAGLVVEPIGKRKRLVVGPQADLIRPLWDMVMAGSSLRDVSEYLKTSGVVPTVRPGIVTRTGWTPSTARNLLLSTLATGLLVDPVKQAQVRATLERRTTPMRRGPDKQPARAERVSPFRGAARCAACGASMVQVQAHGGSGGTYDYFRCSGRVKGLCKAKDLRVESVEAAAWSAVAKGVRSPEYRAELAKAQAESRKAQGTAAEDRAQALSDLDQVKARMGDLALNGPRPGTSEFKALLEPLAAKMRDLEARLARLEGYASAARVDGMSVDMAISALTVDVDRMPSLPLEEQAAAVRALIQSVAVGAEETTVELYLPQNGRTAGGAGGSYTGQSWRHHRHGLRTVKLTILQPMPAPPRLKRRWFRRPCPVPSLAACTASVSA